jgi:hypothetical protein
MISRITIFALLILAACVPVQTDLLRINLCVAKELNALPRTLPAIIYVDSATMGTMLDGIHGASGEAVYSRRTSTIFLNRDMPMTEWRLSHVLAHELGHHYLTDPQGRSTIEQPWLEEPLAEAVANICAPSTE